ncbi:MAG TPA: hypothetical protein VGS09_01250 [Actinomycetota bacterium]|nr:hypothetical protein [Actinomycetota bacterium]
MNHRVVTRDQALGIARVEFTNEVVVMTAEQRWVDLLERRDLDL